MKCTKIYSFCRELPGLHNYGFDFSLKNVGVEKQILNALRQCNDFGPALVKTLAPGDTKSKMW